MFESSDAAWFFEQIQKEPRFAHHKTCECFDNHVFRFRHYVVCLGCSSLAIGVVVAVVGIVLCCQQKWLIGLLSSLTWTLLVGLCLYIPTLIRPFFQVKVYKVVSRMCLGSAIVFLWYGAICLLSFTLSGLILRIVFLLIFIGVYFATMKYRTRFTPDPSASCERGCYPFCEGNRCKLNRILSQLKERTDPDDSFVEFAEKLINSGDGQFEMPVIP